ncbi:MAG: flagellar biosynthesis anti-sigma factor FlgM [Acidimicrobiia bacterium]|nr:flagellar biosynthesis anti-sigma factor FlgM [Acidimicrobiia bacterium]
MPGPSCWWWWARWWRRCSSNCWPARPSPGGGPLAEARPAGLLARWTRRRRLADLRRRIARGRYHVPAEVVADAVLRAWARGGPDACRPGRGDDGHRAGRAGTAPGGW